MSSPGSSSSSSRWCPTPEQVMILEEFYKAGVRTPNATQIQHITCYLSHHGKIEAKNVLYWFQNHKARQRQKLRKTFSKSKNYCRLITQLQLLNSTTSCQFQQGLHQAPFCNCTNSPPTSVVAFLNQQDAVAAAKDYRLRTWAMSNNYRSGRNCGGDEPRSNSFLIREYDKSWRMAPAAAATNQTLCFRSPPQIQSSPPLRTLQLFPVKATHLRKQQCLSL